MESSINNYITEKDPNYFGTSLEDQSQRMEKIVQDAAEEIRKSLFSKKDSQNLFHLLLSKLAKERNLLGLAQNTKEVYKFGERRDSESALGRGECHFYTNLVTVYANYGQKLLEKLKSQVASGFSEKVFPSNSYETSFAWEILSYEELEKRGWIDPTKDALTEAFTKLHCESYPAEEKPRRLKNFADLLEKNKLCAFLRSLNKNHKIFFGALYQDLGEKKELLSQYYAPISPEGWQLPTIFHLDYFQIDGMLKKLAPLFAQCISWNPSNASLDFLNQEMALFRYELSHTMPFCRGSALIQEWLVCAMYQFHGFRVSYPDDYIVDLEAFTTFEFEKFRQNYIKSIHLELSSS